MHESKIESGETGNWRHWIVRKVRDRTAWGKRPKQTTVKQRAVSEKEREGCCYSIGSRLAWLQTQNATQQCADLGDGMRLLEFPQCTRQQMAVVAQAQR